MIAICVKIAMMRTMSKYMKNYDDVILIVKPIDLDKDKWITAEDKIIKLDVFVGYSWNRSEQNKLYNHWWKIEAFWSEYSNCYLTIDSNKIEMIKAPKRSLGYWLKTLFNK